jgi:hypothetical protein
MTRKKQRSLLWNSFLTGLAFALLWFWAEEAATNSDYLKLGSVALVATIGFGFRALFIIVNGFFDRFENRRPRGNTPEVINCKYTRRPMARLSTKR